MIKKYERKLTFKKSLLNFLLRYLSPSNILIIYISQDLDKLITQFQKNHYIKYTRKNFHNTSVKKVAW